MKKLEKIIKYLDGDMIGEEKEMFEQELKSDISLNQTFLLVQEVNQTIANDDLFAYIENLKKAQNSIKLEVGNNPSNKRMLDYFRVKRWIVGNVKLLSAACIVLLFVTSTLLYLNFSKSSNDRLFASFYQRYEADLLTRSARPSDVSELIKAIQLYDKGSYEEAISQFQRIVNTDNANTVAHFFMGISFIETKDYAKAIENLGFVIKQKDKAFMEHAEWYLSLCFIKTNQLNAATLILNKIINEKTFYRAKALEILQKVK